MEVEIDITIFFEKISHFFQMSFFAAYQFLKKYILLFLCHKSPVPSATVIPEISISHPTTCGSVASEVLIYLVDCASSPDPYVDFLILQREVQAYFVPFFGFWRERWMADFWPKHQL